MMDIRIETLLGKVENILESKNSSSETLNIFLDDVADFAKNCGIFYNQQVEKFKDLSEDGKACVVALESLLGEFKELQNTSSKDTFHIDVMELIRAIVTVLVKFEQPA